MRVVSLPKHIIMVSRDINVTYASSNLHVLQGTQQDWQLKVFVLLLRASVLFQTLPGVRKRQLHLRAAITIALKHWMKQPEPCPVPRTPCRPLFPLSNHNHHRFRQNDRPTAQPRAQPRQAAHPARRHEPAQQPVGRRRPSHRSPETWAGRWIAPPWAR